MRSNTRSMILLATLAVLFTYIVASNKDRMDSPDSQNPNWKPSPFQTSASTMAPPSLSVTYPIPTVTQLASSEYTPPQHKEHYDKHGLVELITIDSSFYLDIKYATSDNFTGKVVYESPICLIHKETAKKLIAANNEFKELGYRLKIFDAYRPFSVQQVLWDSAEDKSFVANPSKGSVHNKGAAVDVTLVDEDGNELEMPSEYDEFTEKAWIDYSDCPAKQIENRELLGSIMVKHGFRRIKNEWWHFEDTDASKYPILDILQ